MTIDELQAIVIKGESRTLELKKTTGELKDAMHTVCAMLNSQGGLVVFGVNPTTLEVVGQNVTDNTQREIAREIKKLLPAVSLRIEYVDIPNRPNNKAIVIVCPSAITHGEPYTYDDKPYYKIESTTSVMPRSMFDERVRQSSPLYKSWEDQVNPELTIDDLDIERLRNAVMYGIRIGRIPEAAAGDTNEMLLRKLNLIDKNGIKNAAAVLFIKKEHRYSQFLLRLARFKGTEKREFIDDESGEVFHLTYKELVEIMGNADCFSMWKGAKVYEPKSSLE